MSNDIQKRERGQYFTTTNPFAHIAFHRFIELMPPATRNGTWIEPFAGSCNIPEMLSSVGVKACTPSKWACFDIEPVTDDSNTSGLQIEQRDTLKDYPAGYKVCITNPPYLARNSATRLGLSFPTTSYDDLYKAALEQMLSHTDYIAAIIPESFVTAQNPELKQRLWAIVSLNCTMFDDTSNPVCLALFTPTPPKDTMVWAFSDHTPTATLRQLEATHTRYTTQAPTLDLAFNDPTGQIGLYACDDTHKASIRFVIGSAIDPTIIKQSSRSITRIKMTSEVDFARLVEVANRLLNQWRIDTHDHFLTPFKGLRSDFKYRRRLDYKNARALINLAYLEMSK